jgi:hypothetical protein
MALNASLVWLILLFLCTYLLNKVHSDSNQCVNMWDAVNFANTNICPGIIIIFKNLRTTDSS